MIERYTRPAIVLHWLIAVAVFFNLYYGLSFDDMPTSALAAAVHLHASVGLSILGLVILRMLWRTTHRPPPPLDSLKPWERVLSNGVHFLVYLLILLIPLTGWMMASTGKGATQPILLFNAIPFFHFPVPGFVAAVPQPPGGYEHGILHIVHGLSARLLLVLLVAHVVGAHKQQSIDRAPELQRMWFGKPTTDK